MLYQRVTNVYNAGSRIDGSLMLTMYSRLGIRNLEFWRLGFEFFLPFFWIRLIRFEFNTFNFNFN